MDESLCDWIKVKQEVPSPEKHYSPCKSNGGVMVQNTSEDDHDDCLELSDNLTIEQLRRRSKSMRQKILKSIPMGSNTNDVTFCCESKAGSHANAEPRELDCDFNEPLVILRRKLSRKSSRLKIPKCRELPIPDVKVDVAPVNQKVSSPSRASQCFTYSPADSVNDNEDVEGLETVVNTKDEVEDNSGEKMDIISGEDSPTKSLEEHRSLSDSELPDYHFVHTDFPCVVNTESVLTCIYEREIDLDQQNEACNISDSKYSQSSFVQKSCDAATVELTFVETSKSLSEYSSQLVVESPDEEMDHLVENDLSYSSSTDAAELDYQDCCVSNDSTIPFERNTCWFSEETNRETSSVPLCDDISKENEEIIVRLSQKEVDCFQHKLPAYNTEWNTKQDVTAESSLVSQEPDISDNLFLTTDPGRNHSVSGALHAGVTPVSISGFETPLHDKELADTKTSMCSGMIAQCTKAEGPVGMENFEGGSNRRCVDGECSMDLHPALADASCSPTGLCATNANNHLEKDTFKYHERTPKKLLSNRKVLSPTSQEKLCQAVEAEKLFESSKFSDCKKRLRNEKFGNSPSPFPEVKQLEPNAHPEKVAKKAKGDSHPPVTKGILKSPPSSCKKLSFKMDASMIRSESEAAVKFSQRQMHDIESITGKLVCGIKSMKDIMTEGLMSEAFQCTDLEHINKMKAVTEHASYLEATAEKYLSMMTRDFKRFCKIMRMKENKSPKQNNVQKKQRRIIFADEAGKSLCHVKVFKQLDQDVDVPETCEES